MKASRHITRPEDEVDTADLTSSAGLEITVGKLINVLKALVGKRENLSVPSEMHETETRYFMTFDLPGVSRDDLDVKLADSRLIISGKRRPLDTVNGGLNQSGEASYGKFQKIVMLPPFVDPDKMEANYNDGVLQLTIPKTEASQRSRRITVHYKAVKAIEKGFTEKGDEGSKQASPGRQAA